MSDPSASLGVKKPERVERGRDGCVQQRKRVYRAPRVLFCEGLEIIAATCSGGTAKANVGACPIGPIQS